MAKMSTKGALSNKKGNGDFGPRFSGTNPPAKPASSKGSQYDPKGGKAK